MAQFREVLDSVRLALTWASSAEIRALLEGLVKEEIISEAYSNNLNLHRLIEGIAPKCIHNEPACNLWSIEVSSQSVRKFESSKFEKFDFNDHSQTSLESVSLVDEHCSTASWTNMHPLYGWQVMAGNNQKLIQQSREVPVEHGNYLNHWIRSKPIICDIQCSLRIDDEMPGLLRSAESVQKPVSDSERTDEGNSVDEREWLEQVEEAARRIAVPLWQHWDKGQKMLLPLVPCMKNGCAASEITATDSEAQCCVLGMEEETELAVACRTLELSTGFDNFWEVNDTVTPEDLYFSTNCSAMMTELDSKHFSISGAAGNASPVKTCASTDTDSNLTDRLVDHLRTTKDLLCLTADAQCDTDVTDLLSPCTPKDTYNIEQDGLFYLNTHHSMTTGLTDNLENVSSAMSSVAVLTDILENKEDEESVDSNWGAKMQEEDQDPLLTIELGELPDDLTEFMSEDYLLEPEALFDLFPEDPYNATDIGVLMSNTGDVPMPELPHQDSHQETPINKLKSKAKRKRVAHSQQCKDVSTSSKPKRHRAAGQPKTKDAQTEPVATQNTDAASEFSPAKAAGFTTTPPRIVHLSPPIRFITIPDTSRWLLPFHSTATAPTYILVPTSPPPCKPQVPPLSPVDGAVAPGPMSSSPQGSDTANKAMSSPPLSPNNEISPCKESPLPQSPTVLDIPQTVKDYIQEAKAYMSHTCQEIEEGLSLASHYVDRQVSQREILRCGKNTNKCLDKDLVIMGDTDRRKNLLGQSQIFDASNGDKPKRYILLFGNAGLGKTTLIRKLCLDWSKDCIPQFDFVFLLDGKALTLTEQTYSLQTLLLNLSSFAPPCMDAESVYAQILAAPKRVLIIFDGFDELREYEILLQNQEKDLITSLQKDSKAQTYTVRQLYSAILQRVLLPGCTLLLSTRPKGTASQLLRRADSFLEVCGFTPTDVETYLSQYFTDPAQRGSALELLKNCSYLNLLCWNPGLCRLVCLVLEQSKSLDVLPRTLTGLCHQVLRLKTEKDCRNTHSQTQDQTQTSLQTVEETRIQISSNTQTKTKARVRTSSRTQRAKMAKEQEKGENEVDGEKSVGNEIDRTEEKELLLQLSSLAWEGVKANSSILPTGRTISAKLRAFGLRTGLFLSRRLRTRPLVSNVEGEGGGREEKDEMGEEKREWRRNRGRTDIENTDASDDHILLWANPFLQSYLAGVHLSLSRTVSDRNFLQTLPFQSGPKGRRRPQREEHELTQRFTVGLLFHTRTELQRLHSYTETAFRDMLVNRQALVSNHLQGLSHGDLSPSQVLEVCHYVYEASFMHGEDSDSTQLVTHLAANLPEVLTFHGVPLNPPDVFTVQKVLERGGAEGRSFCLDLEDSGIHVSGLKALVGLNNINTYRACIADVITLWEQLEQSSEHGLLQGAVSKFKIHPLKVTQVCHIEHLAKLVNIHTHGRLSDSSSQSDSILAGGVPAVKELHKLEFELDPEKGPLGLPKLWELLPGLNNLQHLDLEKSKIGDKGAEKLAEALASLSSLEILNLSQNCIGDQGIKKLASTLRDLPKLHRLSLYSNVISDEGAESLAAVLPHMCSLTDLDVSYNKLADVGAQSLAASLRNCHKIKTLRMWNQFIPYGAFERLQQQNNRILSF